MIALKPSPPSEECGYLGLSRTKEVEQQEEHSAHTKLKTLGSITILYNILALLSHLQANVDVSM